MAVRPGKNEILPVLGQFEKTFSLPELLITIDHAVPERTLRRWLGQWVEEGVLRRTGNRRATRYQLAATSARPAFKFLDGLSLPRKDALLKQLRDLWTHTSTAVEGNTLTLGDTHFVLEQGLTISGKPLKDHQEVIGHARAIEILYQSLRRSITEEILFDLHKAVQTQRVTDIYKPYGAWKIEPNGTYTVTRDNRQVYIEYALPTEVPALMREILETINAAKPQEMEQRNAGKIYARLHAGTAHVHPFWDGNGRIARLVSNIPLLRAGLPPIVIPNEERLVYIQLLAEYELAAGKIDRQTGVWPKPELLKPFEEFVGHCYRATQQLVEEAHF